MSPKLRLAVGVLLAGVIGACGTAASNSRHQNATAPRVTTRGAAAMLGRFGAFVLRCGEEVQSQQLWTVDQGVLRQLTHGTIGGVSSMGANDSGAVVYPAIDSAGVNVHVLRPDSAGATLIGAGDVPAIADDGRIAFVRTDQTRRPLRDSVYVYDGKHTRKVASFPLVWALFWHSGKLAAQTGPGRTHLVWDVTHPTRRLTIPGRGWQLIAVSSTEDVMATFVPAAHGAHDLAVASEAHPRFRRIAHNLYALAWSPSGRYLLGSAFAPSSQLSVINIRRHTVAARVGTLACGGRLLQAAWLARGTKLPTMPSG